MKDIFIVGSKGIPAQYGGFETFVDKLTEYKMDDNIKYHVSCMSNDKNCFEYHGAECFPVSVPVKGAVGRILHVSRALSAVEKWCEEYPKGHKAVYILGCRIGPLIRIHVAKLHKKGVKIFCNPDGLEWKRDKWNMLEKKILKLCEKNLISYADNVICDSKEIERYVLKNYPSKIGKTRFIAYGAEAKKPKAEEKISEWLAIWGVKKREYYLIVGRFVPENNYEVMLKEFRSSNTAKKLVIITNVEKNKFYERLKKKTGFDQDPRIKFVGTVYDQELLGEIRQNAYAYLHGHEVGGTNPSLLEALANTKVNLLLDVPFNREVAESGAWYWTKKEGSLRNLIEQCDEVKEKDADELGRRAVNRIESQYSWTHIAEEYEAIWRQEV